MRPDPSNAGSSGRRQTLSAGAAADALCEATYQALPREGLPEEGVSEMLCLLIVQGTFTVGGLLIIVQCACRSVYGYVVCTFVSVCVYMLIYYVCVYLCPCVCTCIVLYELPLADSSK